METKNFSSLLLHLLMVSFFIFLPMISGQYIRFCQPGCTNIMECNGKCQSMGYQNGTCVTNTDILCCCETIKTQVDSLIFSPN
ncbi:hypothetical protein EUTSA_v10029099mg [Eutrema salsugineum]|uniref:Knottin scorpion toxin-like domain-containing protein n=1 Tax=Eutrema salsugineum TaxID=72664 RepID=V4KKZ1_EUTSA|nr:hypothetical protein EUTSA_v10029099mg [Eutrema salsugineum]